MALHQGLKTVLFGVSLGSAMLFVGCASAPPKWERFVLPAPGSSWTQVQRDTGSFGSGTKQVVTSIDEATWEGRKVASYQTATQHLLIDADGFVAITMPAGQLVMRWDPPIGYQWPLEVGKTWTKNHTLTVASSGQKIPFTTNWKVEAYEDVTVPAGTFKAWRVSYSDSLGETQTVWSAPDKMGGFVKQIRQRAATYQPGGAGTREVELVSIDAMK